MRKHTHNITEMLQECNISVNIMSLKCKQEKALKYL